MSKATARGKIKSMVTVAVPGYGAWGFSTRKAAKAFMAKLTGNGLEAYISVGKVRGRFANP